MLAKRYSYILFSIILMGIASYLYIQYEHQKEVIATVGQFEITKQEFEAEMRYRGGISVSQVDKQSLLSEMIEKKLLLNKAYAIGLDKMSSIQREYEYMLIGHIKKEFIEEKRKKITISKGDLEDYYKSTLESYSVPLKRKIAILFFKKRSKDAQREYKVIKAKYAKIIELHNNKLLPSPEKGFGAYAIDYSEHQVSRYRGGELGWFSKNAKLNWEQKVLEKAFALQNIGDTSEIIETDKGYYLVRIMAQKKAKYRDFDEVKSKVKHQIIRDKQKAIKEDFSKMLRSQFKIDISLEKLDEINIQHSSLVQDKKPPSGGI